MITGAAGFIGSHLAEHCLMRGHQVTGLDVLTDYYSPELKLAHVTGLDGHARWRFLREDLCTCDLETLLEEADIVFHLAGQPGVRASWGRSFDRYVDNNVVALQRLLEAARGAHLDRFVFASSSSVYGNAEILPASETTQLRPVSPYGATKALGEDLCRMYRASFDVPVVTLRYFTVYGPRQRPDMAFHRLLTAALSDEEITIFGDGEQSRDFTYVLDAVAATYAAGLRGRTGSIYNIGGGERTTMNAVLDIIAACSGRSLRVTRKAGQIGDARDTSADTTLARADLGFAPSVSLATGIEAQMRSIAASL